MEHDQIAVRLRLALDREAARHDISPGAWPQIERRLRRRAWRLAGIVVACLGTAAAAIAAAFLWHPASRPPVSHPLPHPTPQLVTDSRTHLGPAVTKLAAGYGGVWVIGSGLVSPGGPATARNVAG